MTVLQGGIAVVNDPKSHTQMVRDLPELRMLTHNRIAPTRAQELQALSEPIRTQAFAARQVVVVLRPGITLPDSLSLTSQQRAALRLSPGAKVKTQPAPRSYSGDPTLDSALTAVGVSAIHRMFTGTQLARVQMMRTRAHNQQQTLPIENGYVLEIQNGTVPAAVQRLRKIPAVAYAAPNLRVSTMNLPAQLLPKKELAHADSVMQSGHAQLAARRAQSMTLGRSDVPANYAVAYSAQSMLNAPGVNAIAAYDEIAQRFHQLPGTGEIITNVSLGDVVDSSTNPSPCRNFDTWNGFGPTVELVNGQHYLDLRSLPLIPVYTADDNGNLSGSGSACGEDPFLGEVGLDFSVMSALPHDQQRPGAIGQGYFDLLGIAPGAQYRLVVPQTTTSFIPTIWNGPTTADLVGAIIGAANQVPAPNVITMSLGWGFDAYGFPSRYIEESPVIQAAVAYAVGKGIVVCISSGDGLRTYTNAPVGPSGGTVPIQTVSSGGTSIFDDAYSTTPSQVVDSGAIAVGGTTLNDITSAPGWQPQYAQYRDQLAFPEVRWNGLGSFASGYGSRVNISAPSDNILSESFQGVGIEGGTSASAPEVAAAAAVVMQVARLTGHPFTDPLAVRSFLESTARPVPNVPQADVQINVGPQVDVGNAVETLLKQGGVNLTPQVNRVAISQRYPQVGDFVFTSDTDPTEIDLNDTYAGMYAQLGSSAFAPITIAPDWEGLPKGTSFRLYVNGSPKNVLGTGPWARLMPNDLLSAAGLPLYSQQFRTVNLTYQAYVGFHSVAHASIALTFQPNSQDLEGEGPAPVVPPVVTGTTIPVQYDLSAYDPSQVSNPQLIVSYPGRMSIWDDGDPGYKPDYTVPLTQTKGTVNIPISALAGDGIYGIAVQVNVLSHYASPFMFQIGLNDAPIGSITAYTRVSTAGTNRPAAPILSYIGGPQFPQESGHAIDLPYNSPFQVTWDVSNVPNATGATLEISAPGPNIWGNANTFNNPNGSVLDNNGVDTGSAYTLSLSGTNGTMIVNPWASLVGATQYAVRVVPMNGSKAAGEAGDVSTILTHGIIPSDGGSLALGFDVNKNGGPGILTSNQLDGTGRVDTSIQTFDQGTDLVTSDVALLSTDPGPGATMGSGSMVPFYDMSGFGINSWDNSAFVGVTKQQWDAFGAGGFESVEYLPSLLRPYPYPNCEFCTTINSTSASPLGSFGYDNSSDFFFGGGFNGGVITPLGQYGALGTPMSVPNPLAPYGPDCTGFVAGGGTLMTSWLSLGAIPPGGSWMQIGTLALQPVNEYNGSAGQASTIGNVFLASCNVAMSGDLEYTGAAIATREPGALGPGMFYQTYNSFSYLTSRPLFGYLPIALTSMEGAKSWPNWFAMLDAYGSDYKSNANASSDLEVVNEYSYLTGGDQYMPIGSILNIPIPYDNRLISAGPNGMLYMIGANGYEIAPFLTGL
ncbi:MAG TPA: S8 family serine peptidase [Candidatus Baltobacteraceae bacterium]|nr:S8 family serine peptidase [Candidatus Baltobacteraceae bacterium]